MKMLLRLMALGITFVAFQASQAQEGYQLTPLPTYKNVAQDPTGVWDDSYFTKFGDHPRYPTIYTARIATPKGEWTISQVDSACSIQGDCQFVILLKNKSGKINVVAEGSAQLGRPVILAMNYKKIFTEEIGEGGEGITGSYEVEVGK